MVIHVWYAVPLDESHSIGYVQRHVRAGIRTFSLATVPRGSCCESASPSTKHSDLTAICDRCLGLGSRTPCHELAQAGNGYYN
jgi:hypothetical protein